MSKEAHEPVSPTWDALQKVGEQCLRPQQTPAGEGGEPALSVSTPTGEGEEPCPQPHRYDRGECCGGNCASRSDKRWERRLIAEAICDGYSNGNEQFSDASAAIQHGCLMAADAVMALSRPVAEKPAALAHSQQGGERDGWKLPEDVRALSNEAGVTFDSSSMIESVPQYGGGGALLGWHFSDPEEGARKLSALIKLALRVRVILGAAPTSASKSSVEEA